LCCDSWLAWLKTLLNRSRSCGGAGGAGGVVVLLPHPLVQQAQILAHRTDLRVTGGRCIVVGR